MINFKYKIAEVISEKLNMDKQEVYDMIEVPKEKAQGDYAFPCFKLAKIQKKSPQAIAEELGRNIKFEDNLIEKHEVIGGYLNFFVCKETLAKTVIEEMQSKNGEFGTSEVGKGKTVIVEYSSPNIAKPFHIGHLRNTLIGNALYNTYKILGYNTIGINHLGDYGTQFGKMIEGYKRWHEEYDFKEPIDDLMQIYVRINNLCKEDESILDICRDNFKKLENGEEYEVSLWNKMKNLSLEEFNRIYDILDVKFDSLNGEAFYADKMQEVLDKLEATGKLQESQGAKIIDLEEMRNATMFSCKIKWF